MVRTAADRDAPTPPPSPPLPHQPTAAPAGPTLAAAFAKHADAGDPDTIGPEGVCVGGWIARERQGGRPPRAPTLRPPPPPPPPPSGVEALCADLGLDPTDRRVLLLAWAARAARMGYFSRAELSRAGATLRAETLPALAAALAPLAAATDASATQLAAFAAFAFQYCLTEPGQRVLPAADAAQLLALVLPAANPHKAPLLKFLAAQTEYRVVTADSWAGLTRFATRVDAGCDAYSEDDAWPVLVDNYVDWLRAARAAGAV